MQKSRKKTSESWERKSSRDTAAVLVTETIPVIEKNESKVTDKYTVVRDIILLNVPEENSFVLMNGRRLRNLHDLIDSLEDMQPEVFSYHVTVAKNDFYNWIKDTMKNEDLANEIKYVKSGLETQARIMRSILRRFVE